MRKVLAVLLAAVGLTMGGCPGSAGYDWDRMAAACPSFTRSEIEAIVVGFESDKASGYTKAQALSALSTACAQWTGSVRAECVTCGTVVVDEVWGD